MDVAAINPLDSPITVPLDLKPVAHTINKDRRSSAAPIDRFLYPIATIRGDMRRKVVFGLILTVLWAQGLRVCVHPQHDASSHEGHEHTLVVHLEGALTISDDCNETTSWDESALFALLKNLATKLIFLVALAVLLLFVSRRCLWMSPPLSKSPVAFSHYPLTPPLRAPPR